MGILGGRKRVNRGYNPKYDSKETEFVCKGDLQVLQAQPHSSNLQSQSKRLKSDNQAAVAGAAASFEAGQAEVENHKQAAVLQGNQAKKDKNAAVAPRKVGRPPKDKSLAQLEKQAKYLSKKALKAQRRLEFSNLIARDLKFHKFSSLSS